MPSQHAGTQRTFRFNPEQDALLMRLAKLHGNQKNALIAGLEALERGAPAPTPEQALEVLGELVRQRKPGRARKRT